MTEGVSTDAGFNAEALAAYRPRTPAGSPWADYWYCYVNDPEVGFFKVAFLTYLGVGTGTAQQANLHIAFYPLDGDRRDHDAFSDTVRIDAGTDAPHGFRLEVPGAAVITDRRIELTLPEASITVELDSDHTHYWNGCNPANSPFTTETDAAPRDESHWFIYTLGTPTRYAYRDATTAHHGEGHAYIERGWSSDAPPGFTYLVATSERAKLMLVEGGESSGLGPEFWAGLVIIGDHELRLVPGVDDHTVSGEIDPGGRRVAVEVTQGPYRLELQAAAAPEDFYVQATPSQTVFGAEHGVLKTMDATLDIALRRDETVVERVSLPQSILEFAGRAAARAREPSRG